MSRKIVVGPFNRGLRNDVTAFNVDNNSFPTLINAYQWRGRIKRKRGTSLLGRLERYFDSTSTAFSSTATIALVAGAANIFTGFSLQTNGNIIPGTVVINNVTAAQTYTDLLMDGTLQGSLGGTGTINYATGAITITGGGTNSINAAFDYYPDLPVMGLEDLILNINDFPTNLAFDTKYAYNMITSAPYDIYDVSWYKNPQNATYTGYTAKSTWTPTSWNGTDYQQFYTVNYEGAFWATNGITVPFDPSHIGMQFKPIVSVTVTSTTTATLQITAHGLVQGDFVFVNEVVTTTGINFQTGYVTTVTDANNVVVKFPNATITTNGTGGIAQYLTNRSDATKDCLRWYDGDPTSTHNPTTFGTTKGWVNFMPPLSQFAYSVSGLPADIYYLVGARMIVPFKDRLLFIGPVVQSSTSSPFYLQDTVIYSQNGTPYYTCSYTNTPSSTVDTPTSATNVFFPILVPTNFTATSTAYFEDQTGFGGFAQVGIAEPINSAQTNEDVLILGMRTEQVRMVYSGNDVVPFNFFIINSEYGTTNPFVAVNLDRGVISKGNRGFVLTSQTNCDRVDTEILDEVFQMNLLSNANERATALRDFINEWIYFTYNVENQLHKFPNQTLQYNYRENSWAIFNECYTKYGLFRKRTGFTWATIGNQFPTWSSWNEPWDAGSTTLLQPEVIGGNQQGFILIRDDGTDEGNSLYIQSFSGSVVTSPEHALNEGDFIIITGCIGSISSQVNGKIFMVSNPSTDTFSLDPLISSGTYFGGGVIKRLYVPYVQTKQFPVAWDMGRKTRIGAQQYLLTTTNDAQIQLLIFLSQNASSPYNFPVADNDSLVYSTVLYTCPESTNLGLTPANTNLQIPTAQQQAQTWHRMNTSLIGDTVQLGFTMSEAQMRDLRPFDDPLPITGATQANPCVLTCTNSLSVGQLVQIAGVQGMTQLNGNVYNITAVSPTTITIDVNATGFSTYTSGGTATLVSIDNQIAEIELHGFIIDVSPSQMLV